MRGAERNFQQCKVLISQLNFVLVCLQKIRRASMTLPGRGKKPTSRSAEGRAAEHSVVRVRVHNTSTTQHLEPLASTAFTPAASACGIGAVCATCPATHATSGGDGTRMGSGGA